MSHDDRQIWRYFMLLVKIGLVAIGIRGLFYMAGFDNYIPVLDDIISPFLEIIFTVVDFVLDFGGAIGDTVR